MEEKDQRRPSAFPFSLFPFPFSAVPSHQLTSNPALAAVARVTPWIPSTGAYPASGLDGICEYPNASQGKPVNIQLRIHSASTQTAGVSMPRRMAYGISNLAQT